jgi:hypothetical protein
MSRMLRALFLACALCLPPAACRTTAEPPAEVKRTPVEKPWTKATVEAHEYLWLELKGKRGGFMTGPVLASDEKGEYLTTKDDPSVHLPLADVLVMDSIDVPPPKIDRKPIEKPWTKAAVEAHDHVWIETTTGRRQIVKDPSVAPDWTDDWLTTKHDPSFRVPMSEVLVLDAATLAADQDGAPIAQSVVGSVFAFWTVVVLFIPAIILVAVLA